MAKQIKDLTATGTLTANHKIAVDNASDETRYVTPTEFAAFTFGGNSATGILARTATGDYVARSISVSDGLAIENPTATGGNPTISVDSHKRTHWVPAAAMRPAANSGCAPISKVSLASGRPDVYTLDFDGASNEYAQFDVFLPNRWDSSGDLTFQVVWSHAATTTNFGVAFQLEAVAISDGDTLSQYYGTASQVADTGGTTNDIYITPESTDLIIANSPESGDFCSFQLARAATATGTDTMTIDARVHGIVLNWYEDSLQDS